MKIKAMASGQLFFVRANEETGDWVLEKGTVSSFSKDLFKTTLMRFKDEETANEVAKLLALYGDERELLGALAAAQDAVSSIGISSAEHDQVIKNCRENLHNLQNEFSNYIESKTPAPFKKNMFVGALSEAETD